MSVSPWGGKRCLLLKPFSRILFQKILNSPGIVLNWPHAVLAHLGVARAKALTEDAAGTRIAYQDFFALWKDADPDFPILQQAKAEYAKLR